MTISGEGGIIGTWRCILDSAFESVSRLMGYMHLAKLSVKRGEKYKLI